MLPMNPNCLKGPAVSAIVAAVLVATTILSAWQAVRANSRAAAEWQLRQAAEIELQRAQIAQQKAQHTADEAKSVLDFLHENLLAGGERNRDIRLQRGLNLKQAIDHAVAAIPGAFGEQPLLAASLRHMFGESYQRLGEANLAAHQFEQALVIRSADLGRHHTATISSINNLGIAYGYLGRIDLALPLLEEAYRSLKASGGMEKAGTLAIANNLAHAYSTAGRPQEALALLNEILSIQSARFGEQNAITIAIRKNLENIQTQ